MDTVARKVYQRRHLSVPKFISQNRVNPNHEKGTVMAKAKEAEAAAPKVVLDFNVDFTNPANVAPIAAAAWDAVKGKDDAPFGGATIDFQHILLAHAKSALTTGVLLQGDTNLALFEQEISRLRNAAAK